ncbi:MAG: hypothetical protein J7639_27325 [Paenibacillaceae bacterium]|nr:hypothetical protein [Paenibacillaceae bacterium]
MENKQKVIVTVTHQNEIDYSLEQFEQDARNIARAGGTHIMINQLAKSRWVWERDRNDPYPNWGMIFLSLFKIVVPEPLKPYLPEAYAAENYKVLKERMDIARKYGLKGALSLCEPFYLPEEAYRDHPGWRGPRCEHPRRARNYYYSPCIDNAEVLKMYSYAMEKLVHEMDIEYLFIHTNDSGGGICWSNGLYPGANGPAACKHRSMADRIIGFTNALTEGARASGKQVEIDLSSSIMKKKADPGLNAIAHSLPDNVSVNRQTRSGIPLTHILDVDYEYKLAPLKNVPDVFTFAEKLEKAHQQQSRSISYLLVSTDNGEYFRVIEAFNKQPTRGVHDRIAMLGKVAADIVGAEHAGELMEAWSDFQKAQIHYEDTRIEGLSWTSVNQRWINRPFVLFPHELTEEEKSYYRPYQFQANDEAQANDLLNMQCTSFIRGSYAVGLASHALEKAMERIGRAADAYLRIGERASEELSEKLRLMADRLLLLRCFFQNAVHAMRFQDIIDSTDYDTAPEISPRWPIDADPKLLEYEALTRAEIDNTLRIIELIEGRVEQMLITAPSEELEDIFLLSPRLVDQLRKKIDLMLDHQLDGKRLFVTPNN